MSIIEVTKDNFKEIVLKSNVPVLVDFNANWCGPCQMFKPILEEIAESSEQIKIVSVNIDEADELALEYRVSSIPCLVLFKDGVEVNRSIGLKPKEEIERFLGVK